MDDTVFRPFYTSPGLTLVGAALSPPTWLVAIFPAAVRSVRGPLIYRMMRTLRYRPVPQLHLLLRPGLPKKRFNLGVKTEATHAAIALRGDVSLVH